MEKLIYGREELNKELIGKRKNLEETRNVLNNTLKNKLDIVNQRESLEQNILQNKSVYKTYKKEELKRLINNLVQITGVFGGIALFCNFPFLPIEFNTHTINTLLALLGGFGDSLLVGLYFSDIKDFKKELNLKENKSFSFLEESTNEALLDIEIDKLQKDIKEIDEKISILDERIVEENIDYSIIRQNKYETFANEMSKPKQKCLKK